MNYYAFLNFIHEICKKQRKRKTDLARGTLDFLLITPQPTNTIHMSLGFASGTLSCFIFQHEVPGRPENRGLAGALPVPAKGGHVGGEGVVGEHQVAFTHPVDHSAWLEVVPGGLDMQLATAAPPAPPTGTSGCERRLKRSTEGAALGENDHSAAGRGGEALE